MVNLNLDCLNPPSLCRSWPATTLSLLGWHTFADLLPSYAHRTPCLTQSFLYTVISVNGRDGKPEARIGCPEAGPAWPSVG
jgi:hypothetical protein